MASYGILGQVSQKGARLLSVAWMGMIFVLSSQSSVPVPNVAESQDKFMHLIAFGVLGVLAARGWPPRVMRDVLYLVLAVSVYGIVDEIHQSFVAGRDASVYDWLADTLGGLIGVSWVWYVMRGRHAVSSR